ncbi:hypothetical protein WG906_08230 [Pedobacter sp. P351]|uniref:hypothetical protein n=1 Tax=Pedobacter superstes TaxID=3133441 RepID=UPI003096159C
MDIKEFSLGNLIKISPRENEEGVIFLTDIQHASIIGEMLVPRRGYHFRIKFDEMLPLELSEKWLEFLGFNKSAGENEIWTDSKNFVRFKLSNFESGFLEDNKIAVVIDSIHQLQNVYFTLTGEDLKAEPLNSN